MIETNEEKDNSQLSNLLLSIFTLGYYLFGLLGVISVFLVFIRSATFLDDYIHPIITAISAFGLFIIIPISLILLIFKKTRVWGGFGFLIYSLILGFHLWFWCLILAKVFAGTLWLIIGLFFAGIGIIPIALIATAIASEWSLVIGIVLTAIVIFVCRTIGFAFLDVKDVPNNATPSISPKKTIPLETLLKSKNIKDESISFKRENNKIFVMYKNEIIRSFSDNYGGNRRASLLISEIDEFGEEFAYSRQLKHEDAWIEDVNFPTK